LAGFLDALRAAPWVTMDTEADSLHAYPEKVCLIQMSLPGSDVLLDPLAHMDLSPLWPLLKDRELIMHGCDYDLRLLWRACRFAPSEVFDTMLAARLLGSEAFGLSSLAQQHLGIHLEKGPQKSNWAQRPLPPRMETYARNDSRHLFPLAEILRRSLEEKGRLAWHREMCRRVALQATQEDGHDPDLVWRVKGCGRLNPRALAVLRAVWHWREKEAIACNRPPFFILSTETMVELATSAANEHNCDGLVPPRFSPRRRSEIGAAVAKAMSMPADELPRPLFREAPPRLSGAQRRWMLQLEEHRNEQARRLAIDPTLIASRTVLLNLTAGGEEAREALMSWQRELLFGKS
jgi:ribonuclease D